MLILFSKNIVKLDNYLTSRSARYVLILEQKEYNELMDDIGVMLLNIPSAPK
jgi:hypothetical protein